ncbi:MAG: Bug family tripartite tricarboxylate transporter substrate binding protein [Burkholderiales bacterium]
MGSSRVAGACAVLLVLSAGGAWGQGWRPARVTEFITSSDAGGSNDQVARAMQSILQDRKLVTTPIAVMNRPGGNQTLAVIYLTQRAPDAHYLLLGNPTLFTNHIGGVTPLGPADLTPVALLLVEHTLITVKADSPIRSMRDLVDQLRNDPESLAVGIVSRGGPNHLALSQALKSAGVDARRVKAAVFRTNAESMTALVGGHLQAVASSVSSAMSQVKAGNARALAIASRERLDLLPEVPTLREQGIESWVSNWRAMLGPKGMTAAQVAFWEESFARMAESGEWKKQLELRGWHGQFLRSAEFSKYLDAEYAATRAIMVEIGIVR